MARVPVSSPGAKGGGKKLKKVQLASWDTRYGVSFSNGE